MHSKEIMSGKLSTPRDEKEKNPSDNNHNPPDDINRHLPSNSNWRGINLGDKNHHQRFLTPSDITRQFSDSNMNRTNINEFCIENNYRDNNRFPLQNAANYESQLSCSDENNRRFYTNIGNDNYLNYASGINTNFCENVMHTGKNNCHSILNNSTMNSTRFNLGYR